MSDFLTTGGAGLGGTVLGALGSWFGLKPKIDALDSKVDKLSELVVYTDTCDAKFGGLTQRLDLQNDMLKEIRDILRDK